MAYLISYSLRRQSAFFSKALPRPFFIFKDLSFIHSEQLEVLYDHGREVAVLGSHTQEMSSTGVFDVSM